MKLHSTCTTDQAAPQFDHEWQRRAFGLALALSEFGHYPWSEFQQSLIDTIGAWEQAPGDTRGEWEYYDHWVAALESVVDQHGILHLPVAVDDGGHAAAEHDH
ncbi:MULTISPECIES: nitrile hydratase accessory protein [Mycobacteriaceae]|uniref:Nitrile hydratase accessory protein n=1 Tax=Mycolicibacterium parafortuitum TaxID=39692 RepID=A0ACC6MDM8_MYCPF|nr:MULTISPECIES: nitrile hydratase accessory protein [Mycobacteriaceae]MBX7446461.1 nitrile hydratase accessory protein [Mycolicibacterium aurantiacum]MDZ5085081.1 nitrile hydratase accessory protein [Mycolicibacterium parafortuitum]GFM20961.1 nitrile hydratase accessory protein [Mycobacterium sp. PO1]GFM22075.1 nitrile hydratase accessory protein [Mycobacterium sp. PO2]